MTLKLLTIPFSHYCERARWALDLAGLDYVEAGHLPLLHYLHNLRAGAGQTVPALQTPQGMLKDSADILNYVQQQGLNLYPAGSANEIRAWEERFNRIGIRGRAWAYSHLLGNHALLAELIQACDPLEQKLARPLFAVIGKLMAARYGVTPGRWQRYVTEINAIWSQVDHRLADGRAYLVGETFTAADLTLAALGGVLVMPPEYGYPYPPLEHYPEAMREQIEAWRKTPTGQHILRMYRLHRQAAAAATAV